MREKTLGEGRSRKESTNRVWTMERGGGRGYERIGNGGGGSTNGCG